jgi:hypothetical protein
MLSARAHLVEVTRAATDPALTARDDGARSAGVVPRTRPRARPPPIPTPAGALAADPRRPEPLHPGGRQRRSSAPRDRSRPAAAASSTPLPPACGPVQRAEPCPRSEASGSDRSSPAPRSRQRSW